MHKITKGLKKKKKGKKSKHKEEELFKPEELEAYRKEHQQAASEAEVTNNTDAPAASNDEWKKFNALTAGIDTVLKKTQDDLSRIKSTSFFQRVPTASQVKREAEVVEEQRQVELAELAAEEAKVVEEALESGIVEVSESESEEDEDDIFDTAYIDAIAAGEVKLAYIPESPTDQLDGDDPFDTSIADRAILGPESTRRGKKLLPLGSAVEVLTGRVQAPTCVPIKRPSVRRTAFKEQNLLLGSFEKDTTPVAQATYDEPDTNQHSLLDDDSSLPLPHEPIDLSKTLHQVTTPAELPQTNNVLAEFDVIARDESPLDDEFALLAAESLSKTPAVAILPQTVNDSDSKENWQAFEEERQRLPLEEDGDAVEDDPFDTTFAEHVAPGKCELKIIENEFLSDQNDFDFDPRAEDTYSEIIKRKVSIQITDPAGRDSSLDRISEHELKTLQLEHRDLLGGSITDLSNLGEQPLKPNETTDENYIEYCDPFDTTIIESSTAPGQTELKFLEKELLGDIIVENKCILSDDEFDPRAEEVPEFIPQSRKSSNANLNRSVAFTLPIPSNGDDLFNSGEESKKAGKPLTPYYVRANSIPEQHLEDDILEEVDPFDTSFVSNIKPGKAELKVIEKELFQPSLKHSISDPDFDPRDDKQVIAAKVVQTIEKINNPTPTTVKPPNHFDLLTLENNVETKLLTPADDRVVNFDDISYVDPFDTSIASNILPGKAELKLLETELITSVTIKRVLSDPDFNPRDTETKQIPEEVRRIPNFLEQTIETVHIKPLTPIIGANFEDEIDDIDPFDTSIANNIRLGQTELKLLESELI